MYFKPLLDFSKWFKIKVTLSLLVIEVTLLIHLSKEVWGGILIISEYILHSLIIDFKSNPKIDSNISLSTNVGEMFILCQVHSESWGKQCEKDRQHSRPHVVYIQEKKR